MKLNQTLVLVASFTTALQLATAGNITGKVTLKGTPPAEKEITGVTDAACAAGHTTPMKTRFYVVGVGRRTCRHCRHAQRDQRQIHGCFRPSDSD